MRFSWFGWFDSLHLLTVCGLLLTDGLLVEHKAADHAPDTREATPPQDQLESLWKQWVETQPSIKRKQTRAVIHSATENLFYHLISFLPIQSIVQEQVKTSLVEVLNWEQISGPGSVVNTGLNSPFTQTVDGATLTISVHDCSNIWR